MSSFEVCRWLSGYFFNVVEFNDLYEEICISEGLFLSFIHSYYVDNVHNTLGFRCSFFKGLQSKSVVQIFCNVCEWKLSLTDYQEVK